ncbi:MAG: protein kinase [Oscillospiraceae bacterium]|nr:protein kinase [Oscillospiraceae bacterium]
MKKTEFDPDKRLGAGIAKMSRQELCALVSELCGVIRGEAGANGYRGGVYPENISLNEEGLAAIGPGKRQDWEERELQFIAPELYWGGKLSPASDVYSLGLLLYYGATGGQLPFDGETAERMDGKSFPIPEDVGRQLYQIISKATAFKAADRYQTVGELQAMVDSCLRNRYIGSEGRSQTLFRKDKSELSDVERIMVSILAEEDAGMDRATPDPEAEEEAAPAAEEDSFPTLEERQAAEAAALSEEEEEMERIRALFNAPAEEPRFESDAVAQLPESEEETLQPVPLAMAGEGEDVRVYQPAPHVRREKESAAAQRQPIPILTVEENPELAPVVPSTVVAGRPMSRQEQIAQEVKRRRRRPVAAVLIVCALLILAAIIANSMLQGGVALRGKDPSQANGEEDASGMVTIPTAPPAAPGDPESADQPFDYGTLEGSGETQPGEPAVPKVHRYEVIASDMSWTEARDACREQGGYLAVVSDVEEFNQIVELVIDSGLSRVWVGCHREDDSLVWETSDEVLYYPWDFNEPSYYDGYDGATEDYLLLWHNNRWVYNDSRDDPVADYPELYSGNLGYVIEFEE